MLSWFGAGELAGTMGVLLFDCFEDDGCGTFVGIEDDGRMKDSSISDFGFSICDWAWAAFAGWVVVLSIVSCDVSPLGLDSVSHRGSARSSGITESNDWKLDCCKSLVLRG